MGYLPALLWDSSACIPQRPLRFCILLPKFYRFVFINEREPDNLVDIYIFSAKAAEKTHAEKMQGGKTFKPCNMYWDTLRA